MKIRKLYGGALENPEIAKFLLSAGAGMQNQRTFGAGLGAGMQAGSMSLIDSINAQQKQKLEEETRQKQMDSQFANQMKLFTTQRGINLEDQNKNIQGYKALAHSLGRDLPEDITEEPAKIFTQGLFNILGKEKSYTPITDQAGRNFVIDPKNPNQPAIPIQFGQQVQQVTGQSMPPVQAPQVASGNVNIFNPQPAQAPVTGNPKVDQITAETLTKNNIEAQQKQMDADKKLLAEDPSRLSGYYNTVNNLAGMEGDLKDYQSKVNGTWQDNNLVYDIKKAIGYDPTISNLTQERGKMMVDYIKNLKSEGIAPSQMMNTENEYARAQQAIAGDGPVATRLKAFYDATRGFKQDMQGVEAAREAAAKRLGLPYKPMFDINKIPGRPIVSVKDGNFTIGQSYEFNGKKYRAISPTEVEQVD